MNRDSTLYQFPLIAWFRAAFGDSRLFELEAVAQTVLGTHLPWCWDELVHTLDGGDIGPNLIQPLPDDAKQYASELAHVARRTMACKGVYSVIVQAPTIEDCVRKLKERTNNLTTMLDDRWCFRFFQIGKGNRFDPRLRRTIVERFADVMPSLHIHPVDLLNPVHEFVYLEDHRRPKGVGPITGTEEPRKVYLLYKHAAKESIPHIREWEEKLSLDRRAFLSPTSMEASRSLQLSNMALLGEGKQKNVVDPFCGSASLLLSATALGAKCVGSDKLKYLLLRHKRIINIPPSKHRPQRGIEKVSLYDNFAEQGLHEPSIIHSLDAFSAQAPHTLLKANHGKRFHAMLTDPPYGIRASMDVDEHTLFSNILTLASDLLLPRGMLVFLFPQDTHSPHTHRLYRLAQKAQFTVCNLGWERFQQKQMRMIAVLQYDGPPKQ